MRTCEKCGRPTVAKNAQAKYCSTACRVAAHRQNKRATIPTEMTQKARWIRHDQNKKPLTVTGQSASSTNPTTWASHGEATQSTIGTGLGYVLGQGIGCIDLDHCLKDGQPTDRAKDFLKQYPNNYIEVSPSGDGLHIWGYREEQPGTRQTVDDLNIETYSVGRYITITGKVFQPGTLLPL